MAPKTDNYYIKAKNSIDQLINKLAEQLRKDIDRYHGRKVLIVAISRKAPHIMKKVNQILSDQRLPELEWITEFGLPFIDASQYSAVIIVDDAIYYGSTFEKIKALVTIAFFKKGNDMKSLDIISRPMVVSDGIDVLTPTSYINGEIIPEEGILRIRKSDIPYYVNSIIDFISSQGGPYDVECPVFSIPKTEDITAISEFAHLIQNSIAKASTKSIPCYSVRRYNRSSENIDESYTLLLNKLFEFISEQLRPDIAKFRIYSNEKCFIIASYLINTTDTAGIAENSKFFSQDINKFLWNDLFYNAVNTFEIADKDDIQKFPIFKNTKDSLIRLSNLEHEFRNHCEKTLVMLANWLMSYFMYSELNRFWKDKMNLNISSDISNYLISDNLIGLIGKQSYENLFKKRLEELRFSVMGRIMPMSEYTSQEIIPSKYRSNFEKTLYEDIKRYRGSEISLGVGYQVSAEFSSMHTRIEIPSRYYNHNLFNRLNFGESFNSLFRRISINTIEKSKDERIVLLNQAIDSRIDAGSIVPNYVCQDDFQGFGQWMRLFRSGENDDYMRDQVMRNLLFIFHLIEESKFFVINTVDVLHYVILMLAHYFRKETKGLELFGFQIKRKLNGYKYHAIICLSDNEELDIVDYAVRCGVFNVSFNDLVSIEYSEYTRYLEEGNLFSDRQIESIKEQIDFCCRLIDYVAEQLLQPYEILGSIFYDNTEITKRILDIISLIDSIDRPHSPIQLILEINTQIDNVLRLMPHLPHNYLPADEEFKTLRKFVSGVNLNFIKDGGYKYYNILRVLTSFVIIYDIRITSEQNVSDMVSVLQENVSQFRNSDFEIKYRFSKIKYSEFIGQPNLASRIKNLSDYDFIILMRSVTANAKGTILRAIQALQTN